MSIRKQLFHEIASMDTDETGWIKVTTPELAERIGHSPVKTSKVLHSLAEHGNVEAVKGDDGRITRLRINRAPRSYRDRSLAVVVRKPSRARRDAPRRAFGESMTTPTIDQYAEAKRAYLEVLANLPTEYVTAEFKEQPLAEEALALKTHNEALLSQVKELRRAQDTMERELGYLRTKNDGQLRKGLEDAGVLVTHAQ